MHERKSFITRIIGSTSKVLDPSYFSTSFQASISMFQVNIDRSIYDLGYVGYALSILTRILGNFAQPMNISFSLIKRCDSGGKVRN